MTASLTQPCGNCPFRNDRPFPLTLDRAEEIADSLQRGGSFPCHKTIDYDDESGEGMRNANSKFCAGALILMEHEFDQGAVENQMVRVEQRLGMLDLDALEMNSPVYESFDEWIEAKELEFEEQC